MSVVNRDKRDVNVVVWVDSTVDVTTGAVLVEETVTVVKVVLVVVAVESRTSVAVVEAVAVTTTTDVACAVDDVNVSDENWHTKCTHPDIGPWDVPDAVCVAWAGGTIAEQNLEALSSLRILTSGFSGREPQSCAVGSFRAATLPRPARARLAVRNLIVRWSDEMMKWLSRTENRRPSVSRKSPLLGSTKLL